jgi:hypothetical protein
MKNIHILPTDKPSRIYLIKLNNKLGITYDNPEFTENFGSVTQNQYIYITSNEDINENDYIITKDGRLVEVSYLLSKDLEGASKVILTTDQELIKDGVQAINDEFLEWFVKNPSCESIGVEKLVFRDSRVGVGYEIIIPSEKPKRKIDTCYNFNKEIGCVQIDCICEKEEPKQETLEELNRLTDIEVEKMPIDWKAISQQKKVKQETLEKLADKWVFETNGHKWSNNNNEAGDNFGSFIAGFKEAEKTMYSGEEVLNLLIECSKWQLPQTDEDLSKIKQWFNKFKKK